MREHLILGRSVFKWVDYLRRLPRGIRPFLRRSDILP